MAVIPRRSELSDVERVGLGVAWSKRTFSQTVDAVAATAVVLSDTVPVQRGTVVLHRVLDVDDEVVAPCRPDQGSWILVVDEKAESLAVAIWVAGAIGELKVVRDGVSCKTSAGGHTKGCH